MTTQRALWRLFASFVCLVLAVAQLRSQTLTNQTEPPPTEPTAETADGSGTSLDTSGTQLREGRLVVPDSTMLVDGSPLTANTDLPTEVILKIRRFELYREAYLRHRAELLKLYRGATDADRALLRERFQQLHEAWQKRALEFRQQARERQRELRDKLPSHREALRDALREARERAVDQAQENRKRIGDE